jgi:hypothetical protein
MKKNNVKPTEKQKRAFHHLTKAKTAQEAMLAAGYSAITSQKPKQNLTDAAGFRVLIEEYREDLRKCGITHEILAEIQAEGLFSPDDKVRLDYLKETKKDLGLFQPDNKPANVIIGIGMSKTDYGY